MLPCKCLTSLYTLVCLKQHPRASITFLSNSHSSWDRALTSVLWSLSSKLRCCLAFSLSLKFKGGSPFSTLFTVSFHCVFKHTNGHCTCFSNFLILYMLTFTLLSTHNLILQPKATSSEKFPLVVLPHILHGHKALSYYITLFITTFGGEFGTKWKCLFFKCIIKFLFYK